MQAFSSWVTSLSWSIPQSNIFLFFLVNGSTDRARAFPPPPCIFGVSSWTFSVSVSFQSLRKPRSLSAKHYPGEVKKWQTEYVVSVCAEWQCNAFREVQDGSSIPCLNLRRLRKLSQYLSKIPLLNALMYTHDKVKKGHSHQQRWGKLMPCHFVREFWTVHAKFLSKEQRAHSAQLLNSNCTVRFKTLAVEAA